MVTRYSRRTLLGAGLGGIATLLTGGYAWTRYRTRHTVRIRPLDIVTESDESVTVELTLTDEAGHREENRTVQLDPASGDDEARRFGPWMKYAGEWRIDAALEEHRLELTAAELTDRLEESGWGVDCAHITIVVTADGGLESHVDPSDAC